MKQIAFISIFSLIGLTLLFGLFLVFVKDPADQTLNIPTHLPTYVSDDNSDIINNEHYETAKISLPLMQSAIQNNPYNSVYWLRLTRLHDDINYFENKGEDASVILSAKIARQLNPDLSVIRKARNAAALPEVQYFPDNPNNAQLDNDRGAEQ